MEDLEDGEIDDDPIYSANLSPNASEIDPVFQAPLCDRNDHLFGPTDVDLRFSQNNLYNDCDERLVQSPSLPFPATTDPKNSFLRNPGSLGQWRRPPNVPQKSRPQIDSRGRPPLPFRPDIRSRPQPFRVPDIRPPLPLRIPLLPTPALPPPYRPPHHNFRQSDPPFRPHFESRPDFRPLRPVAEPMPNEWTQTDSKTDSFVISASNASIPFICESTNISKTVSPKRDSRNTDNKSNDNITNRTIVLNSSDIEEVQMEDADEPYDPEQDITPLSPLLIPLEEQNMGSHNRNVPKEVKNNEMSSESQKCNENVFSESKENNSRIERLQRLLKYETNSDNKKVCKKHKSKGVSHKRQSIRMAPKIVDKFVDTMRPISRSAKKVSHNKSCKNHMSRRKTKKMAKRQVIIQKVKQESRSRNMNDTSYEDLLNEYKRIQRELKELEIVDNSKTVEEREEDRQEKENIEKLMQSDDIFTIDDESKTVESEDEDESVLRALALESKMKRELKQKEEREAEEEEQRLRQHLLLSLSRAKAKVVNVVIDDLKVVEVKQESVKSDPTSEPLMATIENLKQESQQRTVSPLIINFGDDSEDEEVEETIKLNEPAGLDSFLKQARLRSDARPISSPSPSVLSITKQKELERLKAEIVRRESIQISEKKLKLNEIQFKSAKERLHEKMTKQKLLKTRVIIKRNALRKAQMQARKLQEEFKAATKLVATTASEFHSFNNELKNIQKEMQTEVQNVTKFEKECTRMGLKLQGNTYKLPTVVTMKRSNSLTAVVSPKKRQKSESNETGVDPKKRLHRELVQQLENCNKLLTIKKSHLMRPSSPAKNKFGLNSEIDWPNASKNLVKELLGGFTSDSVISYNCFTERMFATNVKALSIDINLSENESQSGVNAKSTSLSDSYHSVLLHLHSYRLTVNQSIPITSDHWTNNLNPMQELCKFDLLGTCKDDKCEGQHFDKLLLNPYNKIVDLLLYDPKLAGIQAEIPERMDLELFDAIKQKLLQFAQKLIDSNPKIPIETHCRKIAEQIRSRTQESVVCLTRRLPKMFGSFKSEVPFDDLKYRFNIKDKNFIINQSKISELKISADPDIYFKNRFYAPEGVPISAQLETTLATDPHNIQLWLKLAFYHLSRGRDNFADAIDRALNVLSRALDHNRSEPELYEQYLFIYSNRVKRKGEDKKFELYNICQRVVKHCPDYRVRKCVLALIIDYEKKIAVCDEVIRDFIGQTNSADKDFEIRSHQLSEIYLYKIHLRLQQNQLNESLTDFSNALVKVTDDTKPEINCKHFTDSLTANDRVFLWLCYTYLVIYHNLPYHCFELSKHGFSRLVDKNPFVFNWLQLKNRINLKEVKQHLSKAADECAVDCHEAATSTLLLWAIHLNLAEFYVVFQNDYNFFDNLLKSVESNPNVWPLLVENRFKSERNPTNLIEILKKSAIYVNEEIRLHLTVAKHYHKSKNYLEVTKELVFIASKHYNCLITKDLLIKAFETLLLEDEENNHNFELINARKSKESDSPVIWLSYLLLLQIDGQSTKQIDFAFQTALALCSVDKTDPKDLQLLWSNYLEFSVANIRTEKDLTDLFESVRHCCLTINDSAFQSQAIRFFCRLLPDIEKSKALIQLAKLIPQNVDIVITSIHFGLRVNRKESVWHFINAIIFQLKVRLKCLKFWKIAIGLAIERGDHLSVHKLFQLAISVMPYNSTLWQNFKAYETSVRHIEHLTQADDISAKELKIPFM